MVLAAFLLIGPLLSAQPEAPPRFESEIVLRRRHRLAFLLVSPGGAEARVRTSAILDLVSNLFEAHTDFAVDVVDPERVRDCKGRLACLVQTVRTDYDPARLVGADGSPQPFSTHLAALEKSGAEVHKVLFVLSNIASGRRDRLIPTWVDTTAALETIHRLRGARLNEGDLEAELRRTAVPVRLRGATIESADEAAKYLEGMVTRQLRGTLVGVRHWEPFGELHLFEAPNGAAVIFDGETVGTTRAGSVRLTQVTPGEHEVSLSQSGGPTWGTRFELEVRGTTALTVGRTTNGSLGTAPAVVFWSGLGLAAAGVATVAVGAATAPGDTTVYCPDPCSDRFVAVGETFDGTRITAGGGDVLTVPLGYSMALTGATWSLGTQTLERNADFPWLSFVTGLVLGGAAYAVSAAMDGG